MLVDAHVHVGAWNHADFLERASTLADTLVVLRDAGIGGAAVLPTDQCDNDGLLKEATRLASPDFSLWPFAWIRRTDEAEGYADLEWARAHVGQLCGLKIHPSLSRVRINDDAFRPALDLAEENDLIVLVHCGRWQEIASYKFALDLAESRPGLRLLLAHAGGDTPPLATAAADGVAERKLENVWFDIAGLREFWVLERNVGKIGAERYLMGSDFNLAHPSMYVAQVSNLALSKDERQRILGGNAVELFGPSLHELG